MKKMPACNIILHNEVQVKYRMMQKMLVGSLGEMQRRHVIINTLKPPQNGHLFADDIFKYIFLNETSKL